MKDNNIHMYNKDRYNKIKKKNKKYISNNIYV